MVILTIALLIAFLLPPIYSSEATILIERQEIPPRQCAVLGHAHSMLGYGHTDRMSVMAYVENLKKELTDKYYHHRRIDVVIDGGPVPGHPSSVISLINDMPEVIRQGRGDITVFE